MGSFFDFGDVETTYDRGPGYNYLERLGAAKDLAMHDTFLQGYYRDNILDELEGKDPSKPMSADELNKRFRDVEVPFTQPTSFLVADEINKEAQEKKRLQRIITDNGRESGLGVSLLGGLAAHAMDPVEASVDILLGIATGGLGLYAKGANITRKLGKGGKFVSKGLKAVENSGTTRNMVEGLVANAALEPVMYSSSKRAQQDYDVQDAFISVVGGGLGMPLALAGLGKASGFLAKNAPAFGSHMKANLEQFLNFGKKPNMEAADLTYKKMKSTLPSELPANTVRGDYSFKKLADVDIPNTKFYVSTNRSGFDPDYSHNSFGEYYGAGGVHVTDNPIIANNFSSNEYVPTRGDVYEVSVKDANLYNIDDSINTPIAREVSNTLEDLPVYKEAFDTAPTVREGIDNVRKLLDANGVDEDGVLDLMHSAIKKEGYNGVRFDDGSSNHAFIYNKEALNVDQVFPSDTKSLKPLTASEMEQVKKNILSRDNDFFQNPHARKKAEEIQPFEFKSKSEENFAELKAEMDELKERGLLDEDDIKVMEEVRKVEIEEDVNDSIIKGIMNCFLKGGK